MDFVRLALVKYTKQAQSKPVKASFSCAFFTIYSITQTPFINCPRQLREHAERNRTKLSLFPRAYFEIVVPCFNLVCLFSSDSPWLLGLIETAVHLNAVWSIKWTRLFEIASLPGMRPLLTIAKFTTKYEFQLFIDKANNKVNVTHSLVACCSIRHWYSENSCVHRTSIKWNSLVKGKAHYLGKVLLKLSESCAPKIS